jgi:hypothetical protein
MNFLIFITLVILKFISDMLSRCSGKRFYLMKIKNNESLPDCRRGS